MNYEITVVITRYKEPFEIVQANILSLKKQIGCKVKVLFLDQLESPIAKRYITQASLSNVYFEYRQIPARSLSYARNLGLKNTHTRYVAFTDVDCIVAANWCQEIIKTFKQYHASIVGTKIIPAWSTTTNWFHKSKYIQEFYSLLDVSDIYKEIPKVIGASFAIDKTKLPSSIIFNENLGRKKGNFLGGEETDLCQQVISQGGVIYYSPFTHVVHNISNERMHFSWLLKRAFYGGASRALRKGKMAPFNNSRSVIDYFSIASILPAYILGYLFGLKNYHV